MVSNGYSRAHEAAMASHESAAVPAQSVDDEVDRLKMEIREVKAMIWEVKLKLENTTDADDRQLLRDEQRWLFDETRKIRDEVRLRLEARNIQLQQQRFIDQFNSSNSWKPMSGMQQRLDNPWMFTDFWPPPVPEMPQRDCRQQAQQQQQQQQRIQRDSEMGVHDMSSWLVQPQQQQNQNQKSRLPPLRPRKDHLSGVAGLAEVKTDGMSIQPPKCNNNGNNNINTSSNKRRRNNNNALVKEEQENSNNYGVKEERGKRPRWKDHWVMQLIQVRGGMQEEFNKPPKQGVDLWRQVYTKLVNQCPDFDKEPEACRKKWKMIVTDYKASFNNQNNDERPEKCRWFQMMDEYINIKDIQTSASDQVDTHAAISGLEDVEKDEIFHTKLPELESYTK